jgi:hypothetical protein
MRDANLLADFGNHGRERPAHLPQAAVVPQAAEDSRYLIAKN